MTAKVLFWGGWSLLSGFVVAGVYLVGMMPFDTWKQNLDMCWVLPSTLIMKAKHGSPFMTNPLSSQGRKATAKILVEDFLRKAMSCHTVEQQKTNIKPGRPPTRWCSLGHLRHLTHQSVFFFVSPHFVKDWLVKKLGNLTEASPPPKPPHSTKSRAWFMDY